MNSTSECRICESNSSELCTKCSSYKIEINDVLGRHLIATRKIKSGEKLIKEAPLISGPAQQTAPVCLGVCGRVIRPPAIRPCELCGWPMCGADACKTSTLHEPECFYTRNKGSKITISNYIFPHPNYQCLTILRILYQRDNNKQLWDKLMQLESHCEHRKSTEKYENDRVAVAQFLHRFFKLADTFSEEEILKVCGILQVNGHEIPLSEPPYVAIYDKTSMLEHNCRANCCKSFTSNGEILIHAAVDIQAGEHLSICYTDSLWGTPNRRHYLHETKFFECSCDRCKDPTEFRTFFSALRCNQIECSGTLLPQTFLGDPNDTTKIWHCSTCPNKITSTQVEKILERIGCDLNAMKKGDEKSCKLFLEYYGKLLHHNHYYLTDVRLAYAQIISHSTDDQIEEKIQISTKLIELLEILSPAELRVRGSLLFELHAAIAALAKRKGNDGKTSPYEFQQMLIRSREALASAVQLLQHEPRELAEGQIFIQAQINLQNIDEVLRKLHLTLGDTPV